MHYVIRMTNLALVSHPGELRQYYYVIWVRYASFIDSSGRDSKFRFSTTSGGRSALPQEPRQIQTIKRHHCRHCLHMRNLNSDLYYLFTFGYKHSQHDGCRCLELAIGNLGSFNNIKLGTDEVLCHCPMDY